MHTWFAGIVVAFALCAVDSPAATDKCDEADAPEKGGGGSRSRGTLRKPTPRFPAVAREP